MPRIIAHRGFWWPNPHHQNRPWALNAALERGWDVEVDVWGVRGNQLKIGHDAAEVEWTLPKRMNDSQLFLHIKSTAWWDRIFEAIKTSGWEGGAHWFVSPQRDGYLSNALFVASESRHIDSFLLSSAGHGGVWAEQPDKEWVTADDIYQVHDANSKIYVVASELHGRALDLGWLERWRQADGIVTDHPHLLEKVLDANDAQMHPTEAWW